MEKVRTPLLLVLAAALSVALAWVIRRPAAVIHQPSDTLAVWG